MPRETRAWLKISSWNCQIDWDNSVVLVWSGVSGCVYYCKFECFTLSKDHVVELITPHRANPPMLLMGNQGKLTASGLVSEILTHLLVDECVWLSIWLL